MTKIGNWKSNKARKQDNARRRMKPPVGRTALPKPAPVPPIVSWALRVFIGFWVLILAGALTYLFSG